MANKTIGELPAATTPLTGTELAHVVQGGNSRGTSIDDVRGPILKSIAGLTIAAGDLLVGLGTGLFGKLAKGTAGQVLKMNAGATAPEWSDAGFPCRAWVNFDGTTGSIRKGGNVSSVTRNGTGDYTINFAVAMPDANYVLAGIAQAVGNANAQTVINYVALSATGAPVLKTATQCRIVTANASAGSPADFALIGVMVVG